MDDTQRIVKCGKLSLHSTGGFFKKRWHGKYLVLYDGSKSGIKRLELFDSEIKFKKQNPAKIIPLVDCVRVVTCQRHKTTYTFEVRTSDQFYLLAAQSFQDMNDWVNCLRLVAFGQNAATPEQATDSQQNLIHNRKPLKNNQNRSNIDVLLEKRTATANQQLSSRIERTADYVRSLETTSSPQKGQTVATAMGGLPVAPETPTLEAHPALLNANPKRLLTATQAAAAAASALAKTRQRQPSLLGSCKPQPPTDSPFIQAQSSLNPTGPLAAGQLDTLTPTVRGQLITGVKAAPMKQQQKPAIIPQPTLDEEEENMLYCSIEDNPSEHNYRVKIIETELSLRCQLKCYQLTASTTVNQQYEQLGQLNRKPCDQHPAHVTFYQLIIGPQELTLLNDYAASATFKHQQQGLWSWPYQCIRRYGFDKDNCFMFEAGRKCGSGPGQFIVQTPKAYNIYQDVVKFVNELRSLSSAETGSMLPTAHPSTTKPTEGIAPKIPDTQGKQTTVTQIPVTWTPSINTNLESIDTRQQFFESLRRLDSCSVTQESKQIHSGTYSPSSNPSSTSSATSQHPSISSSPTSAPEVPSKDQVKCDTAQTSDESGCERGDESVDSSSLIHLKPSCAAARKRQANDSMSSASSTSSGGSPGHSVSRRSSTTTVNSQGPSKRSQSSANRMPFSMNSTNKQILSLNSQNDTRPTQDFETELIRDVYSEITKLHAKFAVTSGSPEDSLSSNNSSNDGSISMNSAINELDESIMDGSKPNQEPMYSNLNMPRKPHRRDQIKDEIHGDRSKQHLYTNQREQIHDSLVRDSFEQKSYDYSSSSVYPTILNPIPECGEVAIHTHPKPNNQGSIERPTNTVAKRVESRSGNHQVKKPNQNYKPMSGPLKSKLPTNHYVINDVQYARISRGIR